MLRIYVYKALLKGVKDGMDKDELSVQVYDELENRGLSVYSNGWADNPHDLAQYIDASSKKRLMLSAVNILIELENSGLGLEDNGWFDEDDQWYDWVEIAEEYS